LLQKTEQIQPDAVVRNTGEARNASSHDAPVKRFVVASEKQLAVSLDTTGNSGLGGKLPVPLYAVNVLIVDR
jgi:hypothetical protein